MQNQTITTYPKLLNSAKWSDPCGQTGAIPEDFYGISDFIREKALTRIGTVKNSGQFCSICSLFVRYFDICSLFPCFGFSFIYSNGISKEIPLYRLAFLLRIPAYPDSETGIIRTAYREHPDTLSIKIILYHKFKNYN